jgi:hypothetical protein
MIARFAASILVAIAGSCFAADAATAVHRTRTHDEFVAGVAKFPYAADSARAQRIRVGVPGLQHCMTAAQVVEFLGEPDFSYVAYREGTRNVPEVTVLTYVLAQQAERERETDQRIIVWMGMPDELRAVSVWGVHGLKGLDGSAGMKCH